MVHGWRSRSGNAASSSGASALSEAPHEFAPSNEADSLDSLPDVYDNLPSGHPLLRPRGEALFISHDVEIDAEGAHLWFALLAMTPNAHHDAGLEAAHTVILGLNGTIDDGLVVRKFSPESFCFVFSSQRPMEAALHAETMEGLMNKVLGQSHWGFHVDFMTLIRWTPQQKS